MKFGDTLGNSNWLKENEKALKELFPESWTHIQNLNPLQIGFKLKLLNIDWRTDKEFGQVMTFLIKMGFGIQDKYLVKRNPEFPKQLQENLNIIENKNDSTIVI